MPAGPEQRILELAKEIAERQEARSSAIENVLREIDAQKTAKEAELNATKLAFKRSLSFQVRIDSDLQCPKCWIVYERHSVMGNIPGVGSEDRWRCRACDTTITYRSH